MARSRSLLLGILAAAAAAAGSAALALHPSVRPGLVAADGLLWVETPDFAYSFDAVWRAESLHDLAADPGRRENVAAVHPETTARLRGVMLRKMRLRRLEEVPRQASEAVDLLRKLGYLGGE